jgi:hypothetical protein
MANAFDHENTVYGGMGEFLANTEDWTEQDWRDYDDQMAREIAEFEESEQNWDIFASYDDEPPF